MEKKKFIIFLKKKVFLPAVWSVIGSDPTRIIWLVFLHDNEMIQCLSSNEQQQQQQFFYFKILTQN